MPRQSNTATATAASAPVPAAGTPAPAERRRGRIDESLLERLEAVERDATPQQFAYRLVEEAVRAEEAKGRDVGLDDRIRLVREIGEVAIRLFNEIRSRGEGAAALSGPGGGFRGARTDAFRRDVDQGPALPENPRIEIPFKDVPAAELTPEQWRERVRAILKASVGPDHLHCLECGSRIILLKPHLKTHHAMTPQQYIAKWGLDEVDDEILESWGLEPLEGGRRPSYPLVPFQQSRNRSRLTRKSLAERAAREADEGEVAQVASDAAETRASSENAGAPEQAAVASETGSDEAAAPPAAGAVPRRRSRRAAESVARAAEPAGEVETSTEEEAASAAPKRAARGAGATTKKSAGAKKSGASRSSGKTAGETTGEDATGTGYGRPSRRRSP